MANALGVEPSVEERCHQLLDYWRAQVSAIHFSGEPITPAQLQPIAELAAALKRYDYETGKVLDRE